MLNLKDPAYEKHLASVRLKTLQGQNVALSAELAAVTIATRTLAGDPDPCDPHVDTVTECSVNGLVATVTAVRDGTVATATAGPDR